MLQELISHALTVTLAKKAADKVRNDFEVKQDGWVHVSTLPNFVKVVGIVTMIFWVFLMLMIILQEKDATTLIMCGVIFFGFFLLGLFLLLSGINYKVLYQNHVITHRNSLGITRVYECKDIKEVYYNDSGSMTFVFANNKKFKLSSEEQEFSYAILQGEKIKYKFRGEENPIVKLYIHPILSVPVWCIFACSLVCVFFDPTYLFFTGLMLLAGIGISFSYTKYDKEQKMLIRTRFGFTRTYDMRYHSAKPVYENGFLMYIEIYKYNKKVTKIPISVEYKNRALLARKLCRVDVNK